jgi:hypothetical protein
MKRTERRHEVKENGSRTSRGGPRRLRAAQTTIAAVLSWRLLPGLAFRLAGNGRRAHALAEAAVQALASGHRPPQARPAG